MPILETHRVHRALNIFSVSAHSPVAIRDQMLRAHMIIDRALDKRIISEELPLVVNGAGAAGATAAIYAAARGVPTILAEKRPETFFRQASSRRWIDPVLYDWPAHHWDAGNVVGGPLPLPFMGGFADIIAQTWQQELRAAEAKYPLRVLLNHSFVQPAADVRSGADKQFNVLLKPERLDAAGLGGDVKHERVGMALWAHGYGHEITEVENFAGFEFWARDPVADDDFGLEGDTATIAISGGGDGALQDFLRCVIRPEFRSARDILLQIESLLPQAVVSKIRDAEDCAMRTYLWGPKHDHTTLDGLERAYRQAIRTFTATQMRKVRAKLTTMVRRNVDVVTLITPCTHFGRCYGLNHFLTALLLHIANEAPRGWPLIERKGKSAAVGVISTHGPTHACERDAIECYGYGHQVQIGPSDCDLPPHLALHALGPAPERLARSYNVVIVRHGVQANHRAVMRRSQPMPREVLPYGLPLVPD